MAEIKYKIDTKQDSIFVALKPILGSQEVVYSIGRNSSEEWPIKFYTGTTDMRDWIGNVREITKDNKGNILLKVEGIYRGKLQTLKNIKSKDSKIQNIGDRVMVTEHLNVAGGFDMIATKIRIKDLKKPELNFINIGWSTKDSCRYLRIDPYTGETKELVGNSIPR